MYVSRIDGDVITYDIRMKKPNQGDYLTTGAAHTIEHLFATYARNSSLSDQVIYVGPMGCRTGFYFLTRDTMSKQQAIDLVKESMQYIVDFEGEMPGGKRQECGNYLDHDIPGAKQTAADMLQVLSQWTPEDMNYKD
jgi:S-ribosylhomocysteine lyase